MKYFFLIAILLFSLNTYAQNITYDIAIEKENFIFSENGRYGIKDENNSILLPATYSQITKELNNLYILNNSGYYGIFSMSLKTIVVPVEYSSIYFDNGRGKYNDEIIDKFVVRISKGNLSGLLDHNLQTIIPVSYKLVEISKEYVRLRDQQDKEGIWFFDKSCQNIPLIFDQVLSESYPFLCGFIAKQKDNYFFFNGKGEEIIANGLKVEMLHDNWEGIIYSDYVLFVDKNNKYGIYSCSSNRIIIPAINENIFAFFKDNFIVSKENKYGIINKSNDILVPFLYDSLYFSKPNEKELVIVAKKNKVGLIDNYNNVLIPFKYDEIENLNNQRYKVCSNGKYSMCDNTGKILTKDTYEYIGSQYNGVSAVFNKGMIGYIDYDGKIIEPVKRKIQARGYKSTKALFENFVSVLKTENDSLLMEFTKDLLPDDYSKEFMLRINYTYRGVPTHMSKENMNKAIENSYSILKNFRDNLIKVEGLQYLEFTGLDKNPDGYWDEELNLLGNELRGILKTNNETFYFKLGELICVDGFWKSFTEPRW